MVARCDRPRVMGLWAKHCRHMIPQEYALDFAKVRSLSPEEFVEKLATELNVTGVVAGILLSQSIPPKINVLAFSWWLSQYPLFP